MNPFVVPNWSKASRPYDEHVGRKRQALGRTGEMLLLYALIKPTRRVFVGSGSGVGGGGGGGVGGEARSVIIGGDIGDLKLDLNATDVEKAGLAHCAQP